MLKIILTDPCNESKETLNSLAAFCTSLANAKETHTYTSSEITPLFNEAEIAESTDLGKKTASALVNTTADNVTREKTPAQVFATADDEDVTEDNTEEDDTLLDNVEVDSRGLPWDARIHSRTRSKNKKGHWKPARHVNSKQIRRIETDLQKYTIPAKEPQPTEIFKNTPTHITSVAPPPPPIDAAIPPPPVDMPPAQTNTIDDSFIVLMGKITHLLDTKKLSREKLIRLIKRYGIESLPDIDGHPQLIAQVSAGLDAEML